jgi:hypothetical protein
MPVFDFTSPDGKNYTVEGPEGATQEQAFQMLQRQIGTPQPAPETGMLEDAAKSVGSGLANATAGTLGMAGDARSLLSAGTDALGSKLGVEPDKVQSFKDFMTRAAGKTLTGSVLANAPTSRQIKDSADPIVSPDYEPQTVAGGYLKTGAEFLPGMAMGGPRALLPRFATNVAAPAVASETAGLLTQGTDAEPYARVGGALLGGAGASAAANKFQALGAQRAAQAAIPSADDLLKSGSNKFEAVKASDAVISPSSVERMAKDIKTEMLNAGKHPISEGQAGVFSALDRLEAMGAFGGGVTPKDMEVIRKSLVDLKANMQAGPTARMATEKFMEKYANLGQADLLNGTNPFPTLKNAIGDWAAGKRSNTLAGKVDLAHLNAGTVGTGGNEDNALRQAVKQLARPINNTNTPVAKRLGFNDEEIAGIKGAAMGTPVGNTARFIGKAAPTGIVSGAMSSGAGGMAGGPVGMVALPAVGYVAKKIGDLSTKKAVNALDSLVRSRSPLAAQVAAQLPPQVVSQLDPKTQALLSALIAADPVLSKQGGQPVGQPAAQ